MSTGYNPIEVATGNAHGLFGEPDGDDLEGVPVQVAGLIHCPRHCSECHHDRGANEHHWLEGFIDPADDESVAEFLGDHAADLVGFVPDPDTEPSAPRMQMAPDLVEDLLEDHLECKHCGALAINSDNPDLAEIFRVEMGE